MRLRKWLLIIGLAVIFSSPARGFSGIYGAAAPDDDDERPGQVQTQAPVPGGARELAIDEDDQEKAGIITAFPEPGRHAGRIEAYGAVLQIQDLLEIRRLYVSATGKEQETQAESEVSSKEYERFKGLHQNDRNISDKTLQSADAKRRKDLAKSRTAREAVRIVKANLNQQWGKVIGEWILTDSPAFDRLVRQDDFLVEITVPSNSRLTSPPQKASVLAPAGNIVPVRLISPSPRTDPRFQGLSFFYLAPNRTGGLLPGMNVAAYLPTGPESAGVLIPSSAVVWWQGKAWVYVRKDPTHFIRREIATDMAQDDGWFVKDGFGSEDLIAVKGAQLLLSEEFLKKTKSDED